MKKTGHIYSRKDCEVGQGNGFLLVSAFIDGHLVYKKYIGYSPKESVDLFLVEVNS